MKRIGAAFLFFSLTSAAWAQFTTVAQVVDGDVWQTTFVLTNTTAASAHASMVFYKDTTNFGTQLWNLTFTEGISPSLVTLAAGQTLLLHTPGPSPTLTQGFGQIVADPGVQVYAIFTKRPAGFPAQVGTSQAVSSATRILVPFDNTGGNVTAMALVNSGSGTQTINVNIRTTSGTVTQTALPVIPGQGHAAFVFPTQFAATAGASGTAEFYTSSGTFAILALSFTPAGSLTTAPTYNQSGPPIISGSGSAGSITYAGFSLVRVNASGGFPSTSPDVVDSIAGQFNSFSAAEWALNNSAPTFGSCSVLSVSYPITGTDPSVSDSLLDAGANLPVSGPGLASGAALAKFSITKGPVYALSAGLGTLQLGGTYSLSGTGGTQIGAFNTSATLPSLFTVTNWNSFAAINRANPLTVTWTGSGFDEVVITLAGTTTTSSTNNHVTVTCPVSGDLGTYTVPQAALAFLPGGVTGTLSVAAGKNPGGTLTALTSTSQGFTPSLVGGGSVNYGFFEAFLSTLKSLPIQ